MNTVSSKILRSLLTLFTVFSILFTSAAMGQTSTSEQALDTLLRNLKLNQTAERALHKERERHFLAQRDKQKEMLAEQLKLKRDLAKQYQTLKQDVQTSNKTIKEKKLALDEATHHLKDLFSLAKQVAQDNQKEISRSLTAQQYPELVEALTPFNKSEQLPSSSDLQALWLSLLNEIEASGEVTQFRGEYFEASGKKRNEPILRAGPFSALSHGQYLYLSPEDKSVTTLSKTYSKPSVTGDKTTSDVIELLIDPSLGQLFITLEQEKTLSERIEQGGIVGLVIMLLGVLGLIVTAVKLIQLTRVKSMIGKQLAQPETIDKSNPLGRILAVGKAHEQELSQITSKNHVSHNPIQGLEIRLNEAIMKEAPKLDQGSGLIKLLATVAPLLGLLGTVTGMIATFQAITLFGAGDPKLMAGGISQALVTTVLGLVVAIPLLFAHNLVASRTRGMLVVLSQESLAMVARSIESPEKKV